MRVNKEILLSAGSIGSPHLLQVSGIGEHKKLQRYGIKLVHELKTIINNTFIDYYKCTKVIP
ncbi:MAG: hypothetical protein CL595_02655 [Alteromonas sp.]|nr:hypothetical protein [Alteromonas sp.]